jgi:predicted DNA-binding ribbon-helix-helix protein
MSNKLYDSDLQLWIEQTIQQLQNREFASLDIEHLIDELADLGKSEKNTLRSNLKILLAHLLKLKIQHDVPDSMKASWYSSVVEHRQPVLDNLADTPSLKSLVHQYIVC